MHLVMIIIQKTKTKNASGHDTSAYIFFPLHILQGHGKRVSEFVESVYLFYSGLIICFAVLNIGLKA